MSVPQLMDALSALSVGLPKLRSAVKFGPACAEWSVDRRSVSMNELRAIARRLTIEEAERENQATRVQVVPLIQPHFHSRYIAICCGVVLIIQGRGDVLDYIDALDQHLGERTMYVAINKKWEEAWMTGPRPSYTTVDPDDHSLPNIASKDLDKLVVPPNSSEDEKKDWNDKVEAATIKFKAWVFTIPERTEPYDEGMWAVFRYDSDVPVQMALRFLDAVSGISGPVFIGHTLSDAYQGFAPVCNLGGGVC